MVRRVGWTTEVRAVSGWLLPGMPAAVANKQDDFYA